MNDSSLVIINPSLEKTFKRALKTHRIVLFSAPCGFGKTTVSKVMLSNHRVWELDVVDPEFLSKKVPKGWDVVLVDDLQYILEPERQKALCDFILSQTDQTFVLLSRGGIFLDGSCPFSLQEFYMSSMQPCSVLTGTIRKRCLNLGVLVLAQLRLMRFIGIQRVTLLGWMFFVTG